MENNKHNCQCAMNAQRTDTKVIIEKWRLDSLIEEAEICLKVAGRTVGSTAVAADYPDGTEEHNFAIKDAADCYNAVNGLIDEMRFGFSNVEVVRI